MWARDRIVSGRPEPRLYVPPPTELGRASSPIILTTSASGTKSRHCVPSVRSLSSPATAACRHRSLATSVQRSTEAVDGAPTELVRRRTTTSPRPKAASTCGRRDAHPHAVLVPRVAKEPAPDIAGRARDGDRHGIARRGQRAKPKCVRYHATLKASASSISYRGAQRKRERAFSADSH